MKNFRRRIGRQENNPRAGARTVLARTLRAEALEQRQLMAGDVAPAPHHNSWYGKDVNNDLRVTPLDALVVLNDLNRNGARELGGESVLPSRFIDVNGDNRVSALDALQVINALNRGSGEDVPIVEVMLGLTDDAGNSLIGTGTRTAELSVGEIVNLEILYTDQRLFGAGLGLFTVYTDILVNQTGILEPLVTETQVLSLSENFVDSTGGSVTLSQEGTTTTAVIPFATIAADPVGAIKNAIVANFGYTSDQIFTSLETREPRDPANGRPVGDPFDIYVRFLGDGFIDVDVPNFSIDASGLTTRTGVPVVGSSSEIKPKLPDGTINPVAVGFSLDSRSRTGGGTNIYTNVRSGSFNDNPDDDVEDGFSNIGATGQLVAGGVPAILGPSIPYVPGNPFEAFSIRARVTQPTEDLQLSLNIPLSDESKPNESVLVIYGNRPDGTPGEERGLSPAEYVLGADATLNIIVSAAITARADTARTDEEVVVTTNVLQNDTNNGSGTLTIISTTNGANGAVTFNGPNVTYTPSRDFFGTDTFTYTVQNGDGDRATATVTVTVDPVNDPPTASDFSITVTEGNTRQLANSEFISRSSAGPANENQTPVLQSVIDTGTRGDVTLNADGSVTYIAPTSYEGPDSFVYVISDSVDTVRATVSISVTDQNDPPVATNDTVDAVEDTDLTFTAADFEAAILDNDEPGPPNEVANGQVVTLVAVDDVGSAGGTWTQNANGSFTYSPPDNVFGNAAETFTYTITDGEFEATGTITINLEAVNDRPVGGADPDLVVDELTTNNELDVLANDSAGPLEDAVQNVRVARIVTATTNGDISVGPDGLNVIYTPDDTFIGEDTFTYVITDGELESAPISATINVLPVLRPRARADRYTVNEDSNVTQLPVTSNDLPNEGFAIVLQSISSIPASQGTLVQNGNSVSFEPADDFFGTVTFTYTISDTSNPTIDDPDEIAAATGTVTITVNPVNDNPIFTADPTQTATEDVAVQILASTLLSNDLPGPANESSQTLSILSAATTSVRGGTVRLEGGNLFYKGAADYNSNIAPTDSFTYTISDGAGGTTTGTVTISVTPVNDAPELGLATTLTAQEDTNASFTFAQLLGSTTPGPATATDEASQTLAISQVGDGTTTAGGTVSISGNQVIYRGAQDYFGSDSFTVTVRDSEGATRIGTVTITVNNVNDPPVVGNPPLQAFNQSVSTFTASQLLAGANVGPGEGEVPGQVLSVVGAASVASTVGAVRFNADGSVTYTPVAGFEGNDTFQITVSDGVAATTANVTVTVREFEPSTISGSVFFDYVQSAANPTRNGRQEAHEPGLEMVQVRLVSSAANNVLAEDINHPLLTTIDGRFEFSNVPPGTYQLVFDMPLMIVDGPDFAGTLGDGDSLENQFTIEIEEPGGFVGDDYHFTVYGYSGRAGNAMDLVVANYLIANPNIARDSNNGLMGAKAVLDTEGRGQWFSSHNGFDGVLFGELNLDEAASLVTLSVVMEDGAVKTGIVPTNRRIILRDGDNGFVVQIFGNINSFNLEPDGSLNDDELDIMSYQVAIDRLLGQTGDLV